MNKLRKDRSRSNKVDLEGYMVEVEIDGGTDLLTAWWLVLGRKFGKFWGE